MACEVLSLQPCITKIHALFTAARAHMPLLTSSRAGSVDLRGVLSCILSISALAPVIL